MSHRSCWGTLPLGKEAGRCFLQRFFLCSPFLPGLCGVRPPRPRPAHLCAGSLPSSPLLMAYAVHSSQRWASNPQLQIVNPDGFLLRSGVGDSMSVFPHPIVTILSTGWLACRVCYQ